jgi:hypothetical protein
MPQDEGDQGDPSGMDDFISDFHPIRQWERYARNAA